MTQLAISTSHGIARLTNCQLLLFYCVTTCISTECTTVTPDCTEVAVTVAVKEPGEDEVLLFPPQPRAAARNKTTSAETAIRRERLPGPSSKMKPKAGTRSRGGHIHGDAWGPGQERVFCG